MKYDIFFPENYTEYVDHFNRTDYKNAFSRYSEKISESAQNNREMLESSEFAQGLTDYMISRAKGLWRKRKLTDMQYFLMLYLTPYVLNQDIPDRREIVDSIQKQWSEKTGDSYSIGTYKELSEGFNNTILGFKISSGGKNER